MAIGKALVRDVATDPAVFVFKPGIGPGMAGGMFAVGEQVAADVARRDAEGTTAGYEDMRQILADTFALGEGFGRCVIDLGRTCLVTHLV